MGSDSRDLAVCGGMGGHVDGVSDRHGVWRVKDEYRGNHTDRSDSGGSYYSFLCHAKGQKKREGLLFL